MSSFHTGRCSFPVVVLSLEMKLPFALLLTVWGCVTATSDERGSGLRAKLSSIEDPNTTNNVLVVYYSYTAGGCTERMAKAVGEGAANTSATVRVQRVNETSCDDVTWANAVVVGSPVHFANPASEIVKWFEDLQNVCFGWPLTQLENKIGGAFVDGGGEDKGKDAVFQAIHGALLSMRFIMRGCTEGTCNAWGATATNPDHGGPPTPLSADEVLGCNNLGMKMAELSQKIWH